MSTQAQGPNDNDDNDEDDEPGTLHVGHVSLLTDFLLSSFSGGNSKSPAQYIITSDRDEHIRISRWGKRRAGHLALRYLLGSSEAIGAMCTIEGDDLSFVRQTLASGNESWQRDWIEYPVLLSADGCKLRYWSLHPDALVGQRADCFAVVDLTEFLSSYARIDVWRERRREKIYGKGKIEMRKAMPQLPSLDDTQGRPRLLTPIITRMQIIRTDFGRKLVFSIEGGYAIFTVHLSALFENSADLHGSIDVAEFPGPIIDYHIKKSDSDDVTRGWVLCDTRSDVGDPDKHTDLALNCVEWDEDEDGSNVIDKRGFPSEVVEDRGPPALAASILVYDALTLYPKQEFEATATLESTSAEGLVKGGLSNHEIPGRPASSSNRKNSEHVTRRRETARQAMMKRIEERVVESPEDVHAQRRARKRQKKKDKKAQRKAEAAAQKGKDGHTNSQPTSGASA